MFHAREDWSAAVALEPRPAPAFGRRVEREPFSLTVDLAADLFSRRWWRGAATLALLCGSAAGLAPGFEPLPHLAAEPPSDSAEFQAEALAIAPIASGSRTGLRMTATEAVTPLELAPQRTRIEQSIHLGRDESVERALVRAGAIWGDARHAAALVASAAPRLPQGTALAVVLGARTAGESRSLERLALQGALGLDLVVERRGGALQLVRRAFPVDTTPVRIRGEIGQDGFYWSLRAAGVAPQTAAEYLRALATRADVGEVWLADRFDLVVANRRAADGRSEAGPLLYAGLHRAHAEDVRLMKWTVSGRTGWYDADMNERRSAGMIAPVAGRITSTFGTRIHPILRFARFHSGVDFGARSGTPIVAAADGEVIGAGWAGGYGRQVRLSHGGGIVTTYSHMSSIAAEPGTIVRQGQLIGHVGSSGLSTGPHLHYEVRIGGRPVNPLSVRFESRVAYGPELDAFQARLKALLSIGETG